MIAAILPTYRFYQGACLVQQKTGDHCQFVMRNLDQPLALIQNQRSFALACDRQNSILHAGRTSYTPFGHQLTSAVDSMIGFTGELYEPLVGAYYLGNGYRVYSPILMRFLSADSLSPFSAGGLNAYSYCGNDPINNTDPDGHLPIPGKAQPTIFKIARSAATPSTPSGRIAAARLTETPPPSYSSALAHLPMDAPGLPEAPRYSAVPTPGQYTLGINFGDIDATSPINAEQAKEIAESLANQHIKALNGIETAKRVGDVFAVGEAMASATRVEETIRFKRIALRHREEVTRIRREVGNYPSGR